MLITKEIAEVLSDRFIFTNKKIKTWIPHYGDVTINSKFQLIDLYLKSGESDPCAKPPSLLKRKINYLIETN